MKHKRIRSILLSLTILMSLCIPCAVFAADETPINIEITVCEPVPGQPYSGGYSIKGIDYSMDLEIDDKTSIMGSFSYCTIGRSGYFDYDSTYPLTAQLLCPSIDRPFTGSYTATVNGHQANVQVSEDHYIMYISYDFKTGSREPITEIYLDGYKPVKAGTVPANITIDSNNPGHYTAYGYYAMQYYDDEVSSFIVGKNYQMQISVEAPYDYTFEEITPKNIHINGYDKSLEGITLYHGDGNFARENLEEMDSYLIIILPAETATMNEYRFTLPAPVEGGSPKDATLGANDDMTCTGTTWYRSPDDWFNSSNTVKMNPGDRFEAGYYYFAQPQYSWKDEELTSDAYTIYVNGNTYNGTYYAFDRLRRKTDLNLTVAIPADGASPATTFSGSIPITNQKCVWYYLPNGPAVDGAQQMDPNDTFKAGCYYAFIPGYDYDNNIYEIEGFCNKGNLLPDRIQSKRHLKVEVQDCEDTVHYRKKTEKRQEIPGKGTCLEEGQ